MNHRTTRRQLLKAAAVSTAAVGTWPLASPLAANSVRPRFKIGACDWSMQMQGDPAVFERAKQMGLDGVQISFGAPEGKFDLRQETVRQQFLAEATKQGIEIASLGMGILNSVPLATDERAMPWVEQCIDVLPLLGQRCVLLAFFGAGDIKDRPDLQQAVIRRLKELAPKAERAKVVLGLETWLNADEHLRILDAVGSPAVQVYYDVANMERRGYDIYAEIRRLGKTRICEVHCKENAALLGHGRVDFPKVKDALDAIDWSGWLVIEGAAPEDKDLLDAYSENQEYLRRVFQTVAP